MPGLVVLWCAVLPSLAALVLVLQVQGASTCPVPAAVAGRLRALAAGDPRPDEGRVLVDRVGDEVRLSLLGLDGAVLAERSLVAAGVSCAELEAAAAVIAAAWDVELRYAAGPGLASLPSPPPIPVAAPSVARWQVAASAAGYGSWAGRDATAAATAEVAVGRRLSWLAASALLLGIGEHRVELAPGAAAWRRVALGAGARVRFARGRWWVDTGLHAMLSAIFVEGTGFDRNLGSAAIEPALALTPRAGVRFGKLEIWAGGLTALWLLRRDVTAAEAATVVLPRVERAAGLGLAFDLR